MSTSTPFLDRRRELGARRRPASKTIATPYSWYAIWLGIGIAFAAWKTRGFEGELVSFDLPPEERES